MVWRGDQGGAPLPGRAAGAGRGRAICRRLVDRRGGAIWCEDGDLGGAEFRFVLPAAGPVSSGAEE